MNIDVFLKLCQRRHSVRAFADTPLTDEQVCQILSAARTAPYASGRTGWEVRAVTERETIQAMADLVEDTTSAIAVRDGYQGEWDEYRAHFSAFRSAPAVFVPIFRPSLSLSALVAGDLRIATAGAPIDPERYDRENHLKSIAGAGLLVQLSATALGLGSCVMTGPLLAHEPLARLLKLPRGREIAALIPVGHPLPPTSRQDSL